MGTTLHTFATLFLFLTPFHDHPPISTLLPTASQLLRILQKLLFCGALSGLRSYSEWQDLPLHSYPPINATISLYIHNVAQQLYSKFIIYVCVYIYTFKTRCIYYIYVTDNEFGKFQKTYVIFRIDINKTSYYTYRIPNYITCTIKYNKSIVNSN